MKYINNEMRVSQNITDTKNVSLHLQLGGQFGSTHCVMLLCDVIKYCHVQYSICQIE